MAVLLILATLLAVAGVVGSQPTREPAPPFGLARNGLIAFDSNGDIWVADPDGSYPRALTSGPSVDIDPTWSPDGTLPAYWSLDDPNPDAFYGGADGAHDIWVVNGDGSDEHAVSSDVLDEYWPYWSPDGSRIAYGRTMSGATQVQGNYVTVDPDGSDEIVLPLQPVAGGAPTTWSPDGTKLLAFLAEEGSTGGASVVLLDASGTDANALATIEVASPFNSGSWQRLAP